MRFTKRIGARCSANDGGFCSNFELTGVFSRGREIGIIEDQLDRGAGRISGVETLEEFDELPAAVAVSDERMDLPGKQVDSGQQAQRAMTFVLVIPRRSSRGCRVRAANPMPSLRWPGFPAFRRRR